MPPPAAPSFVRPFPVGEAGALWVRIWHATLGEEPCVVLEQVDAAFGGALFSMFEAVARLYELELTIRGCHPGARLRFVQRRQRQTAAGPRPTFEEVEMRGRGLRRYAVSWTALSEPPLSASCPTRAWTEKTTRSA